MEIYDYNKPGPLSNWFEFLKNTVSNIEGDVLEAGVHRGRSLLAGALILKDQQQSKTIYGLDTFSGFPGVINEKDEIANFEYMYMSGEITQEHMSKVNLNMKILKFLNEDEKLTANNVSKSGNFSNTSISSIEKKAEYLELKNIKLVAGSFHDTLTSSNSIETGRLAGVLLDCDLYESYLTVLNYIWPRLSIGGMIYLDEYYSLKFPGARIACNELLKPLGDRISWHSRIEERDFERWYVIKERE
jgi:hypothetical protein